MSKMRRRFWIFWIVVFAAVFLVLGLVGYSDGDDAYFYQYTHSMGFLEYLSWRYETWVGRMTGEALVYLTFHLGLGFWRPVNALMLVLLPLGVTYLAVRAARIPEGTLKERLWISVAAAAGYLMMSAKTLGYAAVWVNGSIFYTWSFTCGIWALSTFADFIFCETPPADGALKGLSMSMEGCRTWKFFYAIPCAFIASMSIEQMGAVLLVFEILGILYGICKWHRIHPLLLVQTLVTLAAFALLFMAPGNDVRVASEILNWMPQYATMSLGQHIFITIHWLLSSFANENKLFCCVIWIAGMLLLLQKKKRGVFEWIVFLIALIFTIVALLPYVGITAFSDMGMQYMDTAHCIYEVPTIDKFSGMQMAAMIWWTVALIYTFVLIWWASGCQITLLLAYLAGIASEAIMFFSPTLYASGERVYYLTDILYLFVILALSFGISDRKRQNLIYFLCLAFGILNFVNQIPVFIMWS